MCWFCHIVERLHFIFSRCRCKGTESRFALEVPFETSERLGVRNKLLHFRTADTVFCSFPYIVASRRVKLLHPDKLPYVCPLAATRCTTYQSTVVLLCVVLPCCMA
jgi:hypothetical protein